MVLPSQTGLLLPAAGVGKALTVTLVVVLAVQVFAPVTVTVYDPAIAAVEAGMEGF